MLGRLTTEELWRLFGDYEDRCHNPVNPEYALVYATMANAISRIIVSREENGRL